MREKRICGAPNAPTDDYNMMTMTCDELLLLDNDYYYLAAGDGDAVVGSLMNRS